MEKEYKMSAARTKELQEELNYLKTTRSDEVAEQIKAARRFGDLSENIEYSEAKSEQVKLYSRIAELEEIIQHIVVLDESGEAAAQEMQEVSRAQRRLERFWSEKLIEGTVEMEGTAVKEALNALFHTEFKWMAMWPGSMEDRPPDLESYLWEDDGIKTKMEDGTIHVKGAMQRVALMDAMGRIVLLSQWLSQKVFHDSNLDAVCDCIADLLGQDGPFNTLTSSGELKCEYGADGLPVRVYDSAKSRDKECSGDTVWRRSDYREENLIWVFSRKQSGEKVVLKPLEIWTTEDLIWIYNPKQSKGEVGPKSMEMRTADNIYRGKLIWRLKDHSWSEEWDRKFLNHK